MAERQPEIRVDVNLNLTKLVRRLNRLVLRSIRPRAKHGIKLLRVFSTSASATDVGDRLSKFLERSGAGSDSIRRIFKSAKALHGDRNTNLLRNNGLVIGVQCNDFEYRVDYDNIGLHVNVTTFRGGNAHFRFRVVPQKENRRFKIDDELLPVGQQRSDLEALLAKYKAWLKFSFGVGTHKHSSGKDAVIDLDAVLGQLQRFAPPQLTRLVRTQQKRGNSALTIIGRYFLAPSAGHRIRDALVVIMAAQIEGRTSTLKRPLEAARDTLLQPFLAGHSYKYESEDLTSSMDEAPSEDSDESSVASW